MATTKTFRLNAEEELRFEVADTEEGLLKLTEAPNQYAEVFGTELAPRRVYSFPPGSKVAVWTWHGCHIQLEGCSEAYPHKWEGETPMSVYAGIHLKLEEMRELAAQINALGPRIMICGPHDTGKNSLCHVLVNYAARLGRCVIYADLDPSINDICPGCVAAVPVEQPVSIEDSFSLLPHLAYFIGESDPAANSDLYAQAMTNLAKFVKLRMATRGNEEIRTGGLVINTSGMVEKEGYESLVRAIQIFDVNYVVVMDDEKLMSRLHQTFKPLNPGSGMTNQNGTPMLISKVVKSGGVVARAPSTRAKELGYAVKEYFYGSRCQGGHTLRPHRIVISFDELLIFRIGGHKVPSYLLPVGATSLIEPCKPYKMDPSESLLHELGGLSQAATENDLSTANLAGLVHIQGVDMIHKRYTLLVPSPGVLPGKYVIIGNMKWLDTS